MKVGAPFWEQTCGCFLKARGRWAKAIVVTAYKILLIAYCLLRDKTPYVGLGGDYYDKVKPPRKVKAAGETRGGARASRADFQRAIACGGMAICLVGWA